MLDFAAVKASPDAFVAMMKGLEATGASLFIVASPGLGHEALQAELDELEAPHAEVFISAHDVKAVDATSAWKANTARALRVDLFVGADEPTASSTRLLGVPTVLFLA